MSQNSITYGHPMESSIFSDAVHVGSSNEFNDMNEQVGMIIGRNQVLTAAETQIYKSVQKLVKENGILKKVLQDNNKRIQIHYDQCVKWKNQYKEREEKLNQELDSWMKKYDILRGSARSSSITSILDEYHVKLNEVFHVEEGGDNHLAKQVVQETQTIIKDFQEASDPNETTLFEFKRKLHSIKEKFDSLEFGKYDALKQTITTIEDKMQEYPLISLDSYVDLQAKFDELLRERKEYDTKLQNMQELETTNEKLHKELENVRADKSKTQGMLKEKLEQIKSMELRMSERSIEMIVPDYVTQLKSENERLREELLETQEAFNRIDEENGRLQEKNQQFEMDLKKYEGHNVATEKTEEVSLTKLDLTCNVGAAGLKEELQNKIEKLTLERNEALHEKKLQKEQFEETIKRLKKRENKDNDTINRLKKETKELKEDNDGMKDHISTLQKHLNEKGDMDKETEELELQSLQFVNKSDVHSSLNDDEEEGDSFELEIDQTKKEEEEEEERRTKEIAILQQSYDHVTDELQIKEEIIQKLLKENMELEQSVANHPKTSMISHGSLEDSDEMKELRQILREKEQENIDLQEENNRNKKELERMINEQKITNQKLMHSSQALESSKMNLDRYKRDYQTLWLSCETNMKNLKECENNLEKQKQHIDQLTAELIGAKDLIELRNSEIQQRDMQTKKLQEEVDTVPLLKYQIEVYQTDFNAERGAREKLVSELNKLKDRNNELSIENHHLREQLRSFGNSSLDELRRRHVSADRQSSRYPSSGQGGGGNPTLYGRGVDNATARTDTDTVQKTCPKCEKVCPDLDTLQIHLMECLDNESEN